MWSEKIFMDLIQKVLLQEHYFMQKVRVGFDIVELMDSPMAKPTAFLAAKLYYKMLAYYHLAEKQTFIKSN